MTEPQMGHHKSQSDVHHAGNIRTKAPPTPVPQQDTEEFYDFKKFLEDNNAPVPAALASHEAAKAKPGAVDTRRSAVQYAKK